MRVIGREVRNRHTNFGVSRTFLSRHMGQQLSYASLDLATLTFDLTSRRLMLMWVFMLRLFTKLEVRRPSHSEDIKHLLLEHESAW